MNPDDFLVLALKLSAGAGQAELRSAVSRGYYGVFHLARLFVDGCGVTLPESAEAHDKVAKCLQHAGDPLLDAAGSELNSLRSMRNAADYRLGDGRFAQARFVVVQLAKARQIADALRSAQGRIDILRLPMRAYAKDILKLPLRLG